MTAETVVAASSDGRGDGDASSGQKPSLTSPQQQLQQEQPQDKVKIPQEATAWEQRKERDERELRPKKNKRLHRALVADRTADGCPVVLGAQTHSDI